MEDGVYREYVRVLLRIKFYLLQDGCKVRLRPAIRLLRVGKGRFGPDSWFWVANALWIGSESYVVPVQAAEVIMVDIADMLGPLCSLLGNSFVHFAYIQP